MTKDEFMHTFACNENDLQMFDELEQEVRHEERLGESFLKGFNSVNYQKWGQ
jgi:hypothetical protein